MDGGQLRVVQDLGAQRAHRLVVARVVQLRDRRAQDQLEVGFEVARVRQGHHLALLVLAEHEQRVE